jgi:rsbT co-antagonist protein RsbR
MDRSSGRTQTLETNAREMGTEVLLRELVAHLRQNRTQLREEWARRITEAQLLTAMNKDEIFAEATAVYDQYVEALETGTFEALQAYARSLSERIIPRGVETHEVVGIVLLLRDVLARSLFAKYQADFTKLNRILDAYEPAANRIANTVAVGFVQERERVIRQQQEAIRELSTPVLQVRERLLILPIIGVIDPHRARQLTEQLLRGIRTNRAKVVVIDITGVAAMDATVANHLGADGGSFPAAGRDGDRYWTLAGNRADLGDHRRGTGQDEYGRRPAGRNRTGRTPAGLQGSSHQRDELSREFVAERTARWKSRS